MNLYKLMLVKCAIVDKFITFQKKAIQSNTMHKLNKQGLKSFQKLEKLNACEIGNH